jgi:hypothetical protein
MVITNSANVSAIGKTFTIFSFNHFLHWHLSSTCSVARETLVSQTMGSSSPQHDSIPASPRIQPSSRQPEVSASPKIHPISPQPDIEEPFLEPE